MTLSNSEIDQLGDRLRNHCLEDGDLKKLHEFRQTYNDIDAQVYKLIEDALKKSMDKLKLVNAFEEKQLIIQSKPRNKDGYRAIHIIIKINKKSYEIRWKR